MTTVSWNSRVDIPCLLGQYLVSWSNFEVNSAIYPGYYTGRTAHIHTMVHKNWQQNTNGYVVLLRDIITITHLGLYVELSSPRPDR